jgi:hypothetical protein
MRTFNVERQQKLTTAWRKTLVGERFRHYKGDTYVVVCVSLNEADGVVLITYASEKQAGYEWTRSVNDFFQCVADGTQRFTRISFDEGA